MFRKALAGGVMAAAAVALSGAALAPHQELVEAGDICAQETTYGVVPANVGPACVPYGAGVNCQTTLLGFTPTIDTRTYVCVPRP
ncbi:MAG: hypothetical protein JWP11_3100 [Frankiales bacterium]|nr:hypothetical protein [Frankiales bacterium]